MVEGTQDGSSKLQNECRVQSDGIGADAAGVAEEEEEEEEEEGGGEPKSVRVGNGG